MSISLEEVNKLAQLAKLSIPESEKEKVANKINETFGNILDTLQSLDLDKISPSEHALSNPQRLREDKVTEENQRDRMQKIMPSPATESGLFLVNKVIE